MQITGERTVPGIPAENYWFRRHEVVYEYVARLLGGSGFVLEAGCGEGYGANFLDGAGYDVTLLDYDDYTVKHVSRTHPKLRLVRGNLVSLPFAYNAFDAVVSLQTVEHLWDQRGFVAECHRVSRGPVVLSTPNRLTFPPGNIYHTRELSPDEFAWLLADHEPTLLGLHHGPRLRHWETENGDVVTAQIAAPSENWSTRLTELVESVSTDDFEFSSSDLTGSLDLIAVTGG